MHQYGSGHYQTGGVGNSGYTDQQIDEMFGGDKDKVAALLGYSKGLPDWSGKRWDDNNNPYASEPRMNREKAATEQLQGLSENERGDLINRNRRWLNENDTMPNANETWLKDMMAREKEQAEIEKMLGYRLGQQQQVQV